MGRSKMSKILSLGEKFIEKFTKTFIEYEIKINKSDLIFNDIMGCFQHCNIPWLLYCNIS